MDGIDMEELCKVVVIGAGGAVTVALTPAALVALGFTANGIAAGSIAAKLMSYFAIANGGGVAAGGIVAFLQSIGAGGLTWSGTGILGGAGATAGWLLSAICNQTAATP
ncbi:interferon alpha-inducible protein 27-like protein 2A isoform X1 [Parambassis ranga]|uniref:Interferon alpha-inducible protein 27-like protein 2A isoform X1 n=1 Tax=Parambassis ranga TaxID=210632 RepID=A0A6P7HNK0_9TELE|nr:interferon alpha-inducible protein 27-like protein 2A isoform X1 [Parambassis ranga]